MSIAKLRPLIFPELDRISILVDITMMQAAQQCEVVQTGLTSVGPVLDMVTFQEDPVSTSGVGAYPIALAQRAFERTCDRAALASDRQRSAVLVLDDLDHTGITAEPARGLCGHEGLAHLAHLGGVGHVVAQAALWNRD